MASSSWEPPCPSCQLSRASSASTAICSRSRAARRPADGAGLIRVHGPTSSAAGSRRTTWPDTACGHAYSESTPTSSTRCSPSSPQQPSVPSAAGGRSRVDLHPCSTPRSAPLRTSVGALLGGRGYARSCEPSTLVGPPKLDNTPAARSSRDRSASLPHRTRQRAGRRWPRLDQQAGCPQEPDERHDSRQRAAPGGRPEKSKTLTVWACPRGLPGPGPRLRSPRGRVARAGPTQRSDPVARHVRSSLPQARWRHRRSSPDSLPGTPWTRIAGPAVRRCRVPRPVCVVTIPGRCAP